ncbi:hypothetical protein [Frankia sp. AiPa1]|uniref:hypothetical protein n=1 Tax=Frankia sp. AiPa1 TaxID=573492 RepID=UPI00202AFCF4|nr:hypothetical protein [Frankia sp. AiPa1]MCL9760223.1 hypothetical protein [Frankia sp. AiPa1]
MRPVVDSGCALRFTGFCVGEKVNDVKAGIPDTRWFILPDNEGVVSSAVIRGNPPSGIEPVTCPDALPVPTAVWLEIPGAAENATPLPVVLRARGPHVQLVGFAAYYADDPDSPDSRRWHQIGFAGEASPDFTANWSPDQLRLPLRDGDTVPVTAVACLGGGAPTRAADVASLRTPTATAPAALTALTNPLSAQDKLDAGQVACQYPVHS